MSLIYIPSQSLFWVKSCTITFRINNSRNTTYLVCHILRPTHVHYDTLYTQTKKKSSILVTDFPSFLLWLQESCVSLESEAGRRKLRRHARHVLTSHVLLSSMRLHSCTTHFCLSNRCCLIHFFWRFSTSVELLWKHPFKIEVINF